MSVIIRKMTATFGTLEQAVLTPERGLTVISAPNESGKSTWAAFLRVMFYGLDTRERDRAGSLADKNKYQPWSGAPMSGELQLEWEGRDITLRRTTARGGSMQQFEAVYTATGDPVPGLTGSNVGEKLLGVSKDVFTRSALLGQNGAAVTPAPELERRVAALATSGEEDVSFSATQRTLKDWRNHRRSNRANGQIPALEQELREVEQALREFELARGRKEEAARQLEQLQERCRELELEREVHQKLAAKELNRRCGEAHARLEEAEARLAALPDADPALAGQSPAQARETARAMAEQAQQRQLQREQAGARGGLLRRRGRIKTLLKLMLLLFGVGGLVMVIAGFVARAYSVSYWGFGLMFAAVALSILFVALLGRIDRKLSALPQCPPEEDVPVPDADAYIQWLAQRDALHQEVRHCRERFEDLTAQGGQLMNTLELLPTPTHSPQETAALLAAAQQEAALCRTRLDQAIGALRSDPTELESRRAALEEQLERRVQEYDALDLALSTLEQANATLRERFSPTLNKAAGEIFSRLTGGKYSALTLSRDFSAAVGGENVHSSLCLSAGTVDQLYLAVRLALCRLTVPAAPILLDDALCAFDEQRAELALEVLAELGQERQILLFSCHERESRWAQTHGIPVLRL